MKKIIPILILGLVLAGCRSNQPTPEVTATSTIAETIEAATPVASPAKETPWWKTAVFYEIFVRSYFDSNGDGIGDFNGITQKLDYLNDGDPNTSTDLGITALWLMPIHPSPSYHGYDVLNYYAVNSDYGTLDDFKRLLAEAHARGIKVIIDLVLNHTSDQHPFFVSAKSSVNSPYHDWYVWSDTDLGTGWRPATVDGKTMYYYGYFCCSMADLNYRNPAVTEQMDKVTQYWLETVGVDGFRIDAAKHLLEEGKVVQNTPATHAWFKEYYKFYKGINPQVYVVGEVSGSDARITSTYTGDQMDQIFNFEMASGVVNSVNGEGVSSIKSAVTFAQKDMPSWDFGTFLTNHDQDRVMSVLGGNAAKAKLAAFILLTSPGTPFIYYGEEIGMVGRKPDEMIRRPMQWSAATNAGFTSGSPWEPIDAGYPEVNVEAEQKSSDSLLQAYQTLIALRQAHPALSIGEYFLVSSSNSGVYAFVRHSADETLLILVNLTKNAVADYAIAAEKLPLKDGLYHVSDMITGAAGADLTITNGGFGQYKIIDNLPAYSGAIYKIVE